MDEHPQRNGKAGAITPVDVPPWVWSILPAESWGLPAARAEPEDGDDLPSILVGRGIAVIAQELALGRRLLLRQAEEIADLREERGRLVAELEHARAAVRDLTSSRSGTLRVPRDWVLMVLGMLVVLTALAVLLLVR